MFCEVEMRCEGVGEKKEISNRQYLQHKKQRTSEGRTSFPSPTTALGRDDVGLGVGYMLKKREEQSWTGGYGKVDLSPCHICHRKPSERKELEGYVDCEGCGGRTCYVCMRRCGGWDLEERWEGDERDGGVAWESDEMCVERNSVCGDGADEGDERMFGMEGPWSMDDRKSHRAKVCSQCCVERGKEGEIYCLGCLGAEEPLTRVDIGPAAAGQHFSLGRRALLMTDAF